MFHLLLLTLQDQLVKGQEFMANCAGVGFPISENRPAGIFTVPPKQPVTYEWYIVDDNLWQNVIWLKCSKGQSRYIAAQCSDNHCTSTIVKCFLIRLGCYEGVNSN